MKEIPVEAIGQELAEIESRIASAPMDKPLSACVPIIKEGFAKNFSAAVGSDGSAWPPRKIEGDGHPLLIETGALLRAAAGQGPGHVEGIQAGRELHLGVDKSVEQGGIPGAAVHNFGYPQGNLPQREYLYASDETADRAVEVFADEAVGEIFGT